jgi:hypothetical protein
MAWHLSLRIRNIKITMMRKLQYYRLSEAEEIKSNFSTWVGRPAHVGHGKLETLIEIVIKPCREIMVFGKREKGYKVKFKFSNHSFDAYQFMINNGLTPVVTISSSVYPDSKQVG